MTDTNHDTSVQKALNAQSKEHLEKARLNKKPLTAKERHARNLAIEKKLVEREHKERFAAKRSEKTRQHLEKAEREQAKVVARQAHVIKNKQKKKTLAVNKETGDKHKGAGSHLTNLMLKTLEKRRIR